MAKCFVAGTIQVHANDIVQILTSNRLVFTVDVKADKSLKAATKELVPGNVVWVVYDCGDSNMVYKILALVPYETAKEEDMLQMVG
jgi:hypothetical protein